MSSYLVAERFKSVQGEGVYAGTPMAFIRFVGCSVGKKVCHGCDTDFEKMHGWRGGGEYSEDELSEWTRPFGHVCLTGGEPLDQDLLPLLMSLNTFQRPPIVHVETSGTRALPAGVYGEIRAMLWICVSPKPGFAEAMVAQAHEIKVIVPGLGNSEDWPTVGDALRWADAGKIVFLQPRNSKHAVDQENLALCQELVLTHPQLRLSVQLHKLLRVR